MEWSLLNWFRREAKLGPPAATLGSIEIRKPWARAASTVASVGGGFFAMTNTGAAPDRLVAASSPVAEKVEIHALKVEGSAIAMARREDGLALAAGVTLTLQPRGYHLLLIGLKAPLVEGARVPVTLVFEQAGSLAVELTVEAPGLVGGDILD
jgi:copper(I)-binding protein